MLSNIRAKQKRICSAHVYPTTKIGLLLKNIYTMNVGQKSQKLDTTHTQNSNVAASLRLQLTHSMIHKPPCLGVLWKHRKKKTDTIYRSTAKALVCQAEEADQIMHCIFHTTPSMYWCLIWLKCQPKHREINATSLCSFLFAIKFELAFGWVRIVSCK